MFQRIFLRAGRIPSRTATVVAAAALVLSTTASALSSSTSGTAVSSHNQQSSFSFGVIADVQWADADDGYNYARTVKRCYRGAFQTLQSAVDWWNLPVSKSDDDANNNIHPQPLTFIAQLGDLIDGLNAKLGESDEALQQSLQELERAPCPSVNIVGNHELYNFHRAQLAQAKWLRHGDQEYYSFAPAPGWKVFVLDPYQMALIGFANDDPRRCQAAELLQRENPNIDTDTLEGSNWFDGMPRGSLQRRFVPYNGGFGANQLEWLQSELETCRVQNERVILLSHVIVHPQACGGSTMAWDYDQALEIIERVNHKNENDERQPVVVAVLSGHDHHGGYHYDKTTGVHYCTFCSPLNKGTDGKAFGRIDVTPTAMTVVGPVVDDLLPDKGGRPAKQSLANGCESVVLPFRTTAKIESAVSTEEDSVLQK